MKDLRIVFMGTPDFATIVLKSLIENNYNIIGVFSQPDKPKGRGKKLLPTPVKKLAIENNIPVFQPKSVNVGNGFKSLEELNPDIVITVAYGKILKKQVIDLPKMGCWNIHASILPKYRGAAPIQRAIENGESETGISIFKIVEALDAGPVAMIEKISIENSDNLETVHDKLAELSSKMIVEFLSNLNNINLQEQDDSKATYASKITNNDLILDFHKESRIIFNKIRAYDPIPGVKATINNQIVKLFSAEILNKESKEKPGTILSFDKTGIIVKTIDSAIKIGKIKFPGKKTISTFDAINGRKLKIGDFFE
ncbi:methionyl-tRNA formyltransferase [Tepiditoga spiralis]|uniref:Methionyl-tRNA formyltransferase n=1 Tax=Tepiditoga spiralis TaxID=2108365 RepID=A0A7G1G979_9BACT|nr:methionyl-tRNA formyltransferase [Tepiditoga spiralis]BBE29869.1 methionyl-tRNA formyltransferase [Tepiditoga spiralis]